jgi:signal transduction histidine kinase
MRSLRARALIWGLGLALVSILLGGIILFSAFDAIALRRFDEVLRGRQLQVVIALATAGPNAEAMAGLISDPAYDLPDSGRYWQITGGGGEVIASRSQFDQVLLPPAPPSDQLQFASTTGPDGQIRMATQVIRLDSGGPWTVMVAETLASVAEERAEIRNTLVVTFLLVSLLGIGNALLQTSAVLRPLTTLRKEILSRWNSGESLDPKDYPDEVAPLVADINALLARNHDMFERTRRQGADLAHALKTPSAILRNELQSFGQQGAQTAAATEALDRIDAQILRSLARLRAVNAASVARPQTQLAVSVERLARLFRTLPDGRETEFEFRVDPQYQVAMDPADLEEVLGNLLENALKWRKRRVMLSTQAEDSTVALMIEDDGPGIDDRDRDEALRPGGRLDERKTGSGLGLSIAKDLVEAYGGSLDLGRSEPLGGLCVTIRIPTHGAFSV